MLGGTLGVTMALVSPLCRTTAAALIIAVFALTALAACGRPSDATGGASGERSAAPSSNTGQESPSPAAWPTCSSSTPSSDQVPLSTQTWRIYADPNYSFSISYPPTFSFEVQQPAAPINLQLYRAVDRK